MVSPRPSWVSLPVRTITSPPSWRMPTSNETRVRVDGFSKISARVLPANGREVTPPARLKPEAMSSMRRNVAGSKSRRSRKCRDAVVRRACRMPRRAPARRRSRRRRLRRSQRRRTAAARSSMPTAWSMSLSVTTSGGARRSTLSPAVIAISPSAAQAACTCAGGADAFQAAAAGPCRGRRRRPWGSRGRCDPVRPAAFCPCARPRRGSRAPG